MSGIGFQTNMDAERGHPKEREIEIDLPEPITYRYESQGYGCGVEIFASDGRTEFIDADPGDELLTEILEQSGTVWTLQDILHEWMDEWPERRRDIEREAWHSGNREYEVNPER